MLLDRGMPGHTHKKKEEEGRADRVFTTPPPSLPSFWVLLLSLKNCLLSFVVMAVMALLCTTTRFRQKKKVFSSTDFFKGNNEWIFSVALVA